MAIWGIVLASRSAVSGDPLWAVGEGEIGAVVGGGGLEVQRITQQTVKKHIKPERNTKHPTHTQVAVKPAIYKLCIM